MTELRWNLWDDIQAFEVGEAGVRHAVWRDREALYVSGTGEPVLLRDDVAFPCYRLRAEVAIPEQVGFVGLVFGARDSRNFELVYLAPVEIQYDPIMNGSMTWQIYNGPRYQKPLLDTTGVWQQLSVEVYPTGALVYLGDDPDPKLTISKLQHGGSRGKIGFWGYLPGYIRNLTVEPLHPMRLMQSASTPGERETENHACVANWLVSQPYMTGEKPNDEQAWVKATVEENGTLNLNRIYSARQGSAVQVKSEITVPQEQETVVSLGFSDCVRLWINEEEVFQGDWRWNPPETDGRIRADGAQFPVRWRAGVNRILVEVVQQESFGWGLCLRTGLASISATGK